MSNTLGFGLDVNRGGAGYKYQSETVTLLRALTGTYSTPRKIQMDKVIKSLKTAGIWSKLDILQMYAAPTAADAVVNWKSPGTFNATLVNSPTLEADRGITGNGSSSYINSGFNPTTAAINYTINSAGIHLVSRTDKVETAADYGAYINPNYINLRLKYSTTSLLYQVNQATNSTDTNSNSSGIYSIVRTASNALYVRRNKTSISTSTEVSTAIPNLNIFVGALNNNGNPAVHSTRQYALFAVSSGLSTGEADSFADAVELYLDFIGAGVI